MLESIRGLQDRFGERMEKGHIHPAWVFLVRPLSWISSLTLSPPGDVCPPPAARGEKGNPYQASSSAGQGQYAYPPADRRRTDEFDILGFKVR